MSESENSSSNGKSEEKDVSSYSHPGAADVYTPHFGVTHSPLVTPQKTSGDGSASASGKGDEATDSGEGSPEKETLNDA